MNDNVGTTDKPETWFAEFLISFAHYFYTYE